MLQIKRPYHAVFSQVLEQGPVSTQSSILLIIHCILHYVDISSLPTPSMSCDIISTVSKYVEVCYVSVCVSLRISDSLTLQSVYAEPSPIVIPFSNSTVIVCSSAEFPTRFMQLSANTKVMSLAQKSAVIRQYLIYDLMSNCHGC